ncbi:MAG: phospho-N-acetylmuramoyl-pentapeptide-transferase [Acidobacteriota bacterium]|nr:phospho-N-acetylmuramoyl-pentapeptide-transferase [Acidobacteriota bacterium]
MLGDLLFSFADQISVFNVFRYVSVRTAAAAATAIVLSLGLGPFVIARLSRLRVGEQIRADGPAHQHKAGTPTMGGVLILGTVVLSTLLWADLGNVLVWVAVLTMAAYGTLGFVDDWKKLRRADGIGLSARAKFGVQILLGLLVGGFLLWYAAGGEFTTRVVFPFFKEFQPDLGLLFVPAAMVVLLASSNAVNLTDGLDGLAAGCVLVAAAVYTALTYLSGHAEFSAYLDILYVPGASEVTIFGAAITGAALGFLWFNAHPARVFMGDVGSLALGAGIGMQALLIRQEILLVIVGGVFVMETLSVILQVATFKLTGRRLFRMAPLHHHFELAGWKETQVSVRFWILAVLCALATLTTLKLR